jgi:hypothetical protein
MRVTSSASAGAAMLLAGKQNWDYSKPSLINPGLPELAPITEREQCHRTTSWFHLKTSIFERYSGKTMQ